MRPTQPLHRVTIGRTREVRGPDALERGVVGVIIAVVMVIAVWFGVHLMRMVQTLDAVSLAAGPEIDEVVYHTVHGHWPATDTPGIVGGNSTSLHAKNLAIGEDGVITVRLALGRVRFDRTADVPPTVVAATRGYLSLRPQLLGSPDAPTISFLCGYAKPIVGAIATGGANHTTLPRKYLPPFCR